ncbi:translation initiation factor 3 complex subunit L, partial [Tuber borchii]
MLPSQNFNGTNRHPREDSDTDDEVLATTLVEALRDDGGFDDMESAGGNLQISGENIQQRLAAAATPLDFQAPLQNRFDSYDNYCTLFHFILNSDGPVDLELPTYYWAWDVIDEFIYQFNSFCSHRNTVARKDGSGNEEERKLLSDNPQTWGCYSVLNVLYSLIQRSQMNEQLAAIKKGQDPNEVAGEYGSRPLYRMLGYFSIIGLLRVHCLLGDFTLALKTLDDIELNKKAVFARVMAAHFTTYYYVGFSYMMMRRYADAIKAFSHILVYVSRTKNFQKNAQFDSVTKKNDQMYALIAICVALCPTRLDDTIHASLREKYGEQFTKMQRGGPDALQIYEHLFMSACPKFISPIPPDFDNPENNVDPSKHHLQIFMADVRNSMLAPTLKSYLKLYTTMDLKKLAAFIEVDPEVLRTQLLVYKQRSRQTRWIEGGLLEGETINTSDLDFALQGDLIHISEAKVGRRLVDWYLRNLAKTY